MSRVNTENLLRLTPVQPDVAPVVPQPNFISSQFVGGGLELGQAAQNIGQNSEVAMYASLSEIAKGTQQGINNWTDIGSRIEKEKIAEVETQFDRIDLSDDLPENKFEQFDEILRNTSTPLLGNTWRDKFGLQAERNWLSEEGRNKFEEKRYNKELTQFLNRSENKNRQGTPELLEIFHSEYQSKYPTSEYNSWFRVKSFENSSKIIQNQINDAVQAVGPSIDSMFPVPNSEEIKSIMNGNSEISRQYEGFIQLKNGLPTNLPDVEKAFIRKTERDFFESMDPDTPPEVIAEVKKQIGLVGKSKARQIWQAASEMRYLEGQQNIALGLTTAEQRLNNSPDIISDVYFYMSTVARSLPSLNVPLPQKREAVFNLVPKVVDSINQAVDRGVDSNLTEKFPNWKAMKVHERIDAAIQVLEEWSSGNEEGRKQLFQALGFTEEEAKAAGFSSAEKYAEYLIVSNGRTQALNQKSTIDMRNKEIDDSLTNANTQRANIATYQNPDAINRDRDATLSRLSNELGISVESLKNSYRNSDGTLDLNTNINDWFKTLSEVEQNNLIRRGFNLENFAAVGKYRRAAFEFESTANQTLAKLSEKVAKEGQSSSGNVYDISALSTAASKWRYETFASDWISGKFAQSDDNTFKPVFLAYMQDRDLVNKALEKKKSLNDFTEEEKQAFYRAAQIEQEFEPIKNYAKEVDKARLQAEHSAKRAAEQIPKPNAAVKPDLKNQEQKTSKAIESISTGNFKIPDDAPSIIFDTDGTWSQESLGILVALRVRSEYALRGEGPENERKWFADRLNSVLQRITNADFNSDQGKYYIAELATLARAYKETESRAGAPVIFHGTNALQTRGILAGNIFEEQDVNTIFENLNNPNQLRKINLPLLLIRGLAIANNNQRRYPPGTVLVETSYGANEIAVRNRSIVRVASALAAQPTSYELDNNKEWYSGNANPTSADWSVETFEKVLNENGIPISSRTELANQFRGRILSSFSPETRNAMTDEQAIQNGAIVLWTLYERNPSLLYDTLEIALGSSGINNPDLNDQGKADKLTLFFEILEANLDIDSQNSLYNQTSSVRLGVSPVNTMINDRGTVADTAGNTLVVPQPVYTIYGQSDSNTWTNSVGNNIGNLGLQTSVDGQTDYQLVKTRLRKQFKPETFTGFSKDWAGQRDGTNWLLGSMVLDMSPVQDNEARFSLVENWAAMHGLPTLADVMVSNQEPTVLSKQAWAYAERKIVQDILRKALNEPTTLSTVDWLDSIDKEYKAKGGTKPFIRRENFNRTRGGFSELQQNSPGTNKTSALPTWSWINLGLNGVPMIKVSDAYFYTPDRQLFPDFGTYIGTYNQVPPPVSYPMTGFKPL